MGERNYRKYTEEFRLEALALLEQGQKKAGQIKRELVITPGLLLKRGARYQAVEKRNREVHLEPSDQEVGAGER